ncbi:DNA repair protein RadC [Minicystis rosea]|nr:DNA repair protein RadC [Minicystis rosea]
MQITAVMHHDETMTRLGSGPRERALADGITSLSDADLLAVILGTGVAGRPVTFVAAALLDSFGGLDGLARLGPSALAEQPGVGVAKGLRVAAALELGVRVERGRTAVLPVVSDSAQVAAHMRTRLVPLQHEELWVLCLDGKNRVRASRRVAQGGLHGMMIEPRDILRAALFEAASSMILVHNHPSGDPTPSDEDVRMTRAVARAAETVGVPLVDHVILAPTGKHCSLLDIGVLEML